MDGTETLQLSEPLQRLINDVLVWIGFGTVVGLVAKAIMPGRDPGGTIATVLMGIAGSVIGCGSVSYFYEGQRVTPISPIGMVVAVAGAFTILFFYRMLGGYFFTEGEVSRYVPYDRPARRRRRRYSTASFDD